MEVYIFKKLSNDYLELLDDDEGFDVKINVGEVPNIKIFKAHSVVLRHRSEYFRNELKNASKDKKNNKTIHLKNISIQQFEIILKYIYGGTVILESFDESFIFDLMLVAHVFLLKELVQHFETYLIKEKEYWLRSNITRVHQTSFQNDYLQELQKWSNETVARDPEKVFKSEGFTSLKENALVSLVGRDDLQMDEVKIWKYVIEWGIAQIPGLSINPKEWSSENILALKTTLQNCLPLIHYFQISKDDINRSVQPYKQILDETLWKDITKKLKYPNGRITSKVLPPRKILTPLRATNEFSKVINEEDSAEIASWVDYKTRKYSVANNPYNFKLLLRGSRDGFTVKAFWRLCDNIKNIVVVIKVKGTDEVLGGYNPIGWSKPYSNIGGESGYCEDSFIFSLKNITNPKSILSRVKYTDRAIYNSHHTGPCFGGDYIDTDDGTGSEFDLGIYAEGECYCELSAYKELIKKDRKSESGSVSFEMEELEIFQIVKKS